MLNNVAVDTITQFNIKTVSCWCVKTQFLCQLLIIMCTYYRYEKVTEVGLQKQISAYVYLT